MPLTHLTEKQVRHVIACAGALNAAFPPSPAGIDLFDPGTLGKTLAYFSSPEHAALEESIEVLSAEARHELIAVMWLGRGDSGDEFDVLVEQARGNSGDGDVDYISAKSPSLPDYLANGLAAIK